MRNVILFSILIISGCFVSCYAQSEVEDFLKLSNLDSIKEGQTNFEIKLPDMNDKEYNLDSLRGKYVVINFGQLGVDHVLKVCLFLKD